MSMIEADDAEAHIVVTVAGPVPVTVGTAQIVPIGIVEGAPAKNTVHFGPTPFLVHFNQL